MSEEKRGPSVDATVQLSPSQDSTTLSDEVEIPTVSPTRYEVLGEFARGGLGRILKARDKYLSRPVALKELLLQEPSDQRRFFQEALLTARLEHPSIVPVHEAGRWPSGDPFYAMKLVSGKSLAEVLHQTKTLDERLALLPNVVAVCEAVAYAHTQRIIHRDLKPHNILLGSFGETVVIDWGLAKDLTAAEEPRSEEPREPVVGASASLTIAGAVVGTPAYMPPEQARGATVDARADVYSLGAILYELLSGAPPYKGNDSQSIISRVMAGSPTPLSESAVGAPLELIDITQKAMHRDPSQRYPSAKELSEDLGRFLRGQLVASHHYTLQERLGRWIKRNKVSLSVAAIALMVLAVIGVLSLQQLFAAWRLAEERLALAEQRSADLQKAREEELDRSDALILANARAALEKAPTTSLAWLKSLSPRFQDWGAARIIAANARARGAASLQLDLEGDLLASPQLEELYLIHKGGDITRWNIKERRSSDIDNPDGPLSEYVISKDGKYLATRSKQGDIRLISLQEETSALLEAPKEESKRPLRLLFSPDGRYLALWDQLKPCAFRLWETSSKELISLPQPRTEEMEESLLSQPYQSDILRFSPDSQQIACLTQTEVWDFSIKTKAATQIKIPNPESAQIWPSLDFSPDGEALLFQIVRLDNQVSRYLWTPSMEPSQSLRVLDGAAFSEHTFSADGRHLIFMGGKPLAKDALFLDVFLADHDQVLLLDRRTQKTKSFAPREGELSSFLLLSDGHTIAVASKESIYLWDFQAERTERLQGHNAKIELLSASKDGRHLASVSEDKEVRIWDVKAKTSRTLSGHADAGAELAFSPDGEWLFLVHKSLRTSCWDVQTGRHLSFPDAASVKPSLPLKERISSTTRFVAQEDDQLRVWEIAPLRPTVISKERDIFTALRFSPKGKLYAFTIQRELLSWERWDTPPEIKKWPGKTPDEIAATEALDTGQYEPNDTMIEQLQPMTTLAFTKDGSPVVAFIRQEGAGDDLSSTLQGIRVERWEPSSDQTKTLTGYTGVPLRLMLSPDAAELAIITMQFNLRSIFSQTPQSSAYIWRVDDGLRQLPSIADKLVLSASFSGARLALHMVKPKDRDENETYLVEVNSPKSTEVGLHDCDQLQLSKDGEQIACGIRSGKIAHKWVNGIVRYTLNTKGNPPTVLRFSPDQKMLAAGLSNGEVWLWSLSSGESWLLWRHSRPVTQLDFSPDGTQIASASAAEIHIAEDNIPHGMTQLRAWLEQTTNASVGAKFDIRLDARSTN